MIVILRAKFQINVWMVVRGWKWQSGINDGTLFSPAVMWIVCVRERKPWQKKKCFRVIFSLKKKTIQFPLSFDLYFQQKRAPKMPICHLPTKRYVWVFGATNTTNDFSNFKSYLKVVMYVFNSLAKSSTLFWKYS